MPTASTRRRGGMDRLVPAAEALARQLLEDDPRRLAHVAGAAQAAAYVAAVLPEVPAETVVVAAWLHDIGHAPGLARTGFHPVDGAVFLAQGPWTEQVVRLVAHHSHSAVAAEHHGARLMSEFAPVDGLIADVLTFADVVAGADGRGATLRQRLAELRQRPGGDDGVPDEARERRYELVRVSVAHVHDRLATRRSAARSAHRDRSGVVHSSAFVRESAGGLGGL